MRFIPTGALGLCSLIVISVSYFASVDISHSLSPQGCRMSWMNPAYVVQDKFDLSWTSFSQRYSLWLYREDGWDSEVRGVPVLFIPGNAGSSRQVRSIASSAARQFYTSPGTVAPEFASRSLKPLDFFAVEFNEDLSAFHGPTLESQTQYTSRAIDYILSLYPSNTTIILMGHSMGGIVATSLLPSPYISTIITMSTPHTLPPARFDSRIDAIYRKNKEVLEHNPIPILSLCGGATDMMIPSESCVLPGTRADNVLRRTVFTSALEGAWTGVGHREMVWCHQVRWRVARAILEAEVSASLFEKAIVLDRWLRDGHTLPSVMVTPENEITLADRTTYEVLPGNVPLILRDPRGSRTYLLPAPKGLHSNTTATLVLYVSRGTIPPVSPQNPIPLQVTVSICTSSSIISGTGPKCIPKIPYSLRLIPNPNTGAVFPVPGEGTDESEGVVLYEADLPEFDNTNDEKWVGVHVAGADGRGWVVGGFASKEVTYSNSSILSLLLGSTTVFLPDRHTLHTRFTFPKLPSSALIVYRITPKLSIDGPPCSGPLLSPLILHRSQPLETHYFPVRSLNGRILLHSHHAAPYIPRDTYFVPRTLDFSIYSSGFTGCEKDLIGFVIDVDWSATLGRWASRYPTTLVSWAIGVVATLVLGAWHTNDTTGAVPTVQDSLNLYGRKTIRKLLLFSLICSVLPLPAAYYLGNSGEILFAPIAPLLLLVASGLVCISWWFLVILMWPIGSLGRSIFGRRREDFRVHRSTVVSMCLIFALIFLLVPWQVAYLGCWVIHLYTCASLNQPDSFPGGSLTPGVAAIPLIRVHDTDADSEDDSQTVPVRDEQYRINNRNHNMHLLLLMTWLLPLAAPVLAVWVRTLFTAGFTTPFDGDHNFLNVAPFLILVDFASWNAGPLFERQSFEEMLSVRWCLALLAGTAFFIGPRHAYSIFDAAKITIGLITIIRVGRRYWGGRSWSVAESVR
ncbi:GPI-inositol-deacylase [Collybia nuda]|uniref:GPI inositol-deacylase n=1 Tax=Collybia nuda TaxID=64659 RepID=A0A9P5Y7K5_9AGAR|nr:GPI-inositol-deacylase [Collybia nuda]